LNSLCGINLAGHALTLRKIQYDYAFADPKDAQTIEKIRDLARAGSLRRRLKTARLGVVGEHPAGMDTCHLDEPRLKDVFGIEIYHIELSDVFARARSIPGSRIDQTRAQLDIHLDNLSSLDQPPLGGTLSVYHALKEIAAEAQLDGLAVRCWPEFFTEMGCAACGAMSMLSDGFEQSAPLPCSCEADINGTVSQLMLQLLADAPAFGTDMVGVDQEKDLVALWHCGLAPLSMADPNMPAHGGIHSNRKVPLVMDFPLRPGMVTFARLSQATGELRLVVGRGEMLAVPKPFSGTSGTLKLEISSKRFLDFLLHEGLEHHISIVYGDHVDSLVAFAKLAGIPILNLSKEVN
jgi:L-fucose isomerase-like protein